MQVLIIGSKNNEPVHRNLNIVGVLSHNPDSRRPQILNPVFMDLASKALLCEQDEPQDGGILVLRAFDPDSPLVGDSYMEIKPIPAIAGYRLLYTGREILYLTDNEIRDTLEVIFEESLVAAEMAFAARDWQRFEIEALRACDAKFGDPISVAACVILARNTTPGAVPGYLRRVEGLREQEGRSIIEHIPTLWAAIESDPDLKRLL